MTKLKKIFRWIGVAAFSLISFVLFIIGVVYPYVFISQFTTREICEISWFGRTVLLLGCPTFCGLLISLFLYLIIRISKR